MCHRYHKRSCLFGFTLIEFMMGLLVSVMILGCLFKLFLTASRSLSQQQTYSTMPLRAQSVIEVLNTDIHSAGQIGCSRLTEKFLVLSSTPYEISAHSAVQGLDSEVTVRYQALPVAKLIEPMRQLSEIKSEVKPDFSKKDTLLISDCEHAELFQPQKIRHGRDAQIITPSVPLKFYYGANAEIGRLVINRYYLDITRQRQKEGTPVYALFQQNLHGRREQLVNDISSLRFKFDIMENGQVLTKNAGEVQDWSRVIGVSYEFKTGARSWWGYAAVQGRLP